MTLKREDLLRQLDEVGIPVEEWESASFITKTQFISACARVQQSYALARQAASLNRIAACVEQHFGITGEPKP